MKRKTDISVFDWWRIYATAHPGSALVKLARVYLSIPPTSVESERLFSQATLTFATDLRDRLNPEKVEMILVLKAYLLQKEQQAMNNIEI